MLGRIAKTLGRAISRPTSATSRSAEYLHSVVETMQMSYLATVLGIVRDTAGLVRVVQHDAEPTHRVRVARLVIMGCRSVHEMIWTILLVAVLGFGMLPGTLALTLFCIGFAGKLFTEAIEAIRPGPVEAIRATGGNRLQIFIFAVLPQVRVAWTGISIYTWDVVFRAATVVGFFGAGGMGWYLRESVQRVASQGCRRHPAVDHRRRGAVGALSAWLRTRDRQGHRVAPANRHITRNSHMSTPPSRSVSANGRDYGCRPSGRWWWSASTAASPTTSPRPSQAGVAPYLQRMLQQGQLADRRLRGAELHQPEQPVDRHRRAAFGARHLRQLLLRPSRRARK